MNNNIVLFTDFDRTIIFSKKFLKEKIDCVCIEKKEGKEMSYMTKEAFTLLNEVKQKVTFVPVSTRTWETMLRVDFIRENMPELLICNNGGRIYHNGKLLKEWEEMIESSKQQYPPVTELAEEMKKMFHSHGIIELLIHEDCYLMIKFEEMTKELRTKLERLNLSLQKKGYRVEINSNKAYIFPEFIKKELAVKFLMDRLNANISISAGDSIMDLEMLRLTNYAIAPKHKTFAEDFMEVTEKEGMLAGEEILRYIQHTDCCRN